MGRVTNNPNFYNDFIVYCKDVIKTSYTELHSCIDKLHYVYSDIIKHKDILNRYNIKVTNPIWNIRYIDLVHNKDIKHIDKRLLYLLRVYNYLAFKKTDILIKRIELYNTFSTLDRVTYNRLIYTLNHNIVNFIVKGGNYSFNAGVGSIRIVKTKRSGEGAVNIAATNQTYNSILEANLVPQSVENPDGVPYLIRHKKGDTYYKWNYRRNREVLNTFKNEYFFIANRTYHSVRECEGLTKEEIYNGSMSGVVKMFTLMRIDPNYHTRYTEYNPI